jgi:5'-3' exonuclease
VLKGLKGGSLEWADPRELEAEFRISFRKWTLFRAITGDKSDNIPQVFDGVGPVTAAEFIKNGINPSLVAFDDHPKKVKIRYGHPFQIRKKTVEFKGNWERIHLNYRLSRIVTDHTDECLSEEVRKALASLFKGMSYKSFYRKEECLDDFGWQKMTNFFVKHDMSDLMEKRQLLWRLP